MLKAKQMEGGIQDYKDKIISFLILVNQIHCQVLVLKYTSHFWNTNCTVPH